MTLDQWATVVAKQALETAPEVPALELAIVDAIKTHWAERPSDNQTLIDERMREFNALRGVGIKNVRDANSVEGG